MGLDYAARPRSHDLMQPLLLLFVRFHGTFRFSGSACSAATIGFFHRALGVFQHNLLLCCSLRRSAPVRLKLKTDKRLSERESTPIGSSYPASCAAGESSRLDVFLCIPMLVETPRLARRGDEPARRIRLLPVPAACCAHALSFSFFLLLLLCSELRLTDGTSGVAHFYLLPSAFEVSKNERESDGEKFLFTRESKRPRTSTS